MRLGLNLGYSGSALGNSLPLVQEGIAEKLYARLGWVTMERRVYRGEAVVIMRRTLEVRRGFSTLP